ncbi:M23 family metallopeptidase [Streptomyces johnsoniae]|uniref:Peptidoglycan DD-metalloendopeptidase family protein n=1 Tax=Streptomyces johnsoniae TaxID=3075532 RepID=A0ABU2RWZ2_9ACTN|nr:peptidoglycan DD-metalloendopeptidase family protein [Streptomyces sp. DSM 41886]MDT0441266.1 peptidoglycan DD-metalloendopeptidase family protein [Streptomyces sp. DSM 41886]
MAVITFAHVRYGSRDSCVAAFQRALMAKGFAIAAGATGYYGEQTKAACAAFQRAQGWRGAGADGVPGAKTFAGLGFANGARSGGAAGRVASPVQGREVTYPYGVRNSRYAAGFHTGDDYAAPAGTPVVAVRGGTIAWSNGEGGAYGQWIGLRADNGRDYVYCHLATRSVEAGARVSAGQRIGEVGDSGATTGPHLHLEDRPHGGGYGEVRRPSW